MAELNVTINKSIVLKTYNQSNIEHFSRCSVRIRHNDKCVKYKFFVVQSNGTALLRMPDIELLSVLRVMHETIGNKANGRKFNAQTRHAAHRQNCSTNRPDRQSWMQITQAETKPKYPIILILAQTKLKFMIIVIPTITKE